MVAKELFSRLVKENFFIVFLFVLVVLILFYQAQIPLWQSHLQVDVVTFFNRAKSFWQNNSWLRLELNEYQPGALLFFLIPSVFLKLKESYSSYLSAFFYINVVLIGFHFLIYRIQKPISSVISFMFILLFSGPILFYRFELLTSLLCIFSFFLWIRDKKNFSALILGIAVSVKLYPMLLIPYLLILSFKKDKSILKILSIFLFFMMGAFIPVFVVWFLGLSLGQLWESLQFHSLKSIGLEGMPAMVLTVWEKLTTGAYPQYISAYGINGLIIKNELPRVFYNWLWLPPVLAFYIFLFLRKENFFRYEIPFLAVQLFLIFSKGLNPQYIFWFLLFFPLFSKYKDKIDYFADLFLILLVVFLTQLIYPILYTDFLQKFYTDGTMPQIFYLQVIRNVAFLILFVRVFWRTFMNKCMSRG